MTPPSPYLNRIIQYVIECPIGSTHRELVNGMLESLGTRLTLLNEMSSKGTHRTATAIEAETCVVWTYLTAADVMRISEAEQTPTAMVE